MTPAGPKLSDAKMSSSIEAVRSSNSNGADGRNFDGEEVTEVNRILLEIT